MEIKTPEERILLLKDQLTDEMAEKIAWTNKINAFGTFRQVSNFLSRPKDQDFTLVYKEHRYIPFLHIKGSAKYLYDRTVTHEWPTSGAEVLSLILDGKEYIASKEHISAVVIEHCKEESSEELFIDSLSSLRKPEFERYIKFPAEVMNKSDLENLAEKNVVLPPQARASAFVREIASKMIQNIEADKILEENVEFQTVDTYYHSFYAYKYHWESKNKESVVIIDGLTGQVSFSQDGFKQLVGKVFDYDFLFDIGKDAAGMLIPGGSIAIKLAKKYMDVTKQKNAF